MECCGEPFGIGSTVEWVLCPVSESRRKFFRSVFGDDAAERVTDTEEGHGGGAPDEVDLPVVTGVVRSIERAAWVLQPRPEDLPMSEEPDVYAVPGSVVVEARSTAEPWEGGETYPPRHGWFVDIDVPVADEANA
jgi:hypothetical protein